MNMHQDMYTHHEAEGYEAKRPQKKGMTETETCRPNSSVLSAHVRPA